MSTLLLRLSGPMQSWGTQSRFTVRDTGREPSKSGVIGLLCAALGRPRAAPLDDLVALKMGVRVDREGILSRDYHTAMNVRKAGGGLKDCEPSARYYLADASFLVGLEGDWALLQRLQEALRRPVWPLYLGRKAFVPGEPIVLANGLQEGCDLMQAFVRVTWAGRAGERRPDKLRVVRDDPTGSEVRCDLPLSFAERTFTTRRVTTEWLPIDSIAEV